MTIKGRILSHFHKSARKRLKHTSEFSDNIPAYEPQFRIVSQDIHSILQEIEKESDIIELIRHNVPRMTKTSHKQPIHAITTV